ncbi:MAG: RDD family protein [Gammaproteobacteria bacterium]|nr:RDD family protein [Gammaproteobacteria bacterium]
MTIQRASASKRIFAYILDLILVAILTTGFMFLVSKITKYDSYNQKLKDYYAYYEEKYNIDFSLTASEREALDSETQERYNEAQEDMNSNKDMVKTYRMTINLVMINISISIFLSILILEFILPLILKDGQTIGKKIFSICLMKNNEVKVSTLQLFARTLLGKYVIETMIPVLLIIMINFGMIGILGTIIVLGLLIAQIALFIATRNRTVLHDILAVTIVVDKQSQRIFNSESEMLEYKTKINKEEVQKKDY